MIRLSDSLAISKNIASKEMNGVLYLLDPQRGHLHTCNNTAKLIWRALEKKASIQNIIISIEQEYGITRSRAKNDVMTFLEKMVTMDVLRIKQRHSGIKSS